MRGGGYATSLLFKEGTEICSSTGGQHLLIIAWGKAECHYANHECYNPKLYEKTSYWLLIINLAKLTVHYNKYEYVRDSQVYGIQVYSILYSLQQVVFTYKFTSL